MRRQLLCCFACLLILLPIGCRPSSTSGPVHDQQVDQGSKLDSEIPSVKQRVAALTQAYENELRLFRQSQKAFPDQGQTEPDGEPAGALAPDANEYAFQIMGILEESGGDLANLEGIHWILREVPNGPNRLNAIEMLRTEFHKTAEIGDLLPVLVDGYPDPASMQLLEQLAEESQHNRVKAIAKMAHVKGRQAIFRFLLFLDNPKWTERMKSFVDDSTLEFYRSVTSQENDLVERLKELGPNSAYGRYTYGVRIKGRPAQKIDTMASQMLFSLQHLQVGKPAPNIKAEDLDGQTFSLDEYRGKVVMLDFWGDW